MILAPDQPPIHDVTEVTKIINSVSIQIKIVDRFDDSSNGSGNKTKPAPTISFNLHRLLDFRSFYNVG